MISKDRDHMETNLTMYINLKYGNREIPIISSGLIFVQKTVLLGLFSRSLFSEGLVIVRNSAFQNGFGLTIKTA